MGHTVAQMSATNNPTPSLWQIGPITPASAGTWFGIDTFGPTPGRVFVTPAGETGLNNTTQTITINVTAANANGPGSALLTVNAQASTGINDGSANAPFPGIGNGNWPNWFDNAAKATSGPGGFGRASNYATRPTWKVAGVDYYVGHPTNIALKNIDTADLTGTGLVRDGSFTVYLRNINNPIIDGFDFSTGPQGHELIVDTNVTGLVTIRNCKFKAAAGTVGGDMLKANTTGYNMLVQKCSFDWNFATYTAGSKAVVLSTGAGNTCTMEYCYVINGQADLINFGGGTNANPSTYIFRYCFFANAGTNLNTHGDWISSASDSTETNPFQVTFCVFMNNVPQASTQGLSFACDVAYHVRRGLLDHCVIGPGNGVNHYLTMSLTGASINTAIGPVTVTNNFWDPTPGVPMVQAQIADGSCAGTATGFTQGGNINIVTNAPLTF